MNYYTLTIDDREPQVGLDIMEVEADIADWLGDMEDGDESVFIVKVEA